MEKKPTVRSRDAPKGGVLRRGVEGFGSTSVSMALTWLVGLCRTILLARWIAPEIFGQVALAVFMTQFISRLLASGLSRGVLHANTDDGDMWGTYMSLRGLSLLLLGGLGLGAAGLGGLMFPEVANLGYLIAGLVAAELLVSVARIQETSLRRSMAFEKLAALDVGCSLTLTAVALALAWHGFGLWALMAEPAVGAAVRFMWLWGPARDRPFSLRWHPTWLRFFWGYARGSWAGVNMNFIARQLDILVVGAFFGATTLGLYAKAREFAIYPERLIARLSERVLLPVLSKLQSRPGDFFTALTVALTVAITGGLLTGGGLYVALPMVVPWLLGPAWTELIILGRILVPFALLLPVWQVLEQVSLATGYPAQIARARAYQIVVFVTLALALYGEAEATGVALATSLGMFVAVLTQWRTISKRFRLDAVKLWGLPLLCTGLGVAGAVATELLVPETYRWLALVPFLFGASVVVGIHGTRHRQILAVWLRRKQGVSS